jgi:hypothetical protein
VDALGMKVITKLLDTADNNKGFFDSFKSRLKNWINNVIKHFRVFFLKAVKDPFYFILPFAVILAAAFIRFKNSIIHASYSHIDVYSQLLNIKYLGINEIYHNGIYPFGYHSVISAISKLSFVDPYWVSRFIGPMVGLFMVLSVYYVTLKLTGSRIASLIPLVIYSLVNSFDFPSVVFRQTAALPQEFAALFVLPGFYFLWIYLKTQQKYFIFVYLAALAIDMSVHQFAAVFLVLFSCALLLAGFMFLRLKIRFIIKTIIYCSITSIAAFIPIVIGLLSGKTFHKTSIAMVEVINLNTILDSFKNFSLSEFISKDLFLEVITPIVLIMLISLLFKISKERKALVFTIAVSTMSLYFLYRISDIIPADIIPELLTKARIGVFFSLMLPVFYALTFIYIEKGISKALNMVNIKFSRVVAGALAILICTYVIYLYPPNELYKGNEEYDAAASSYLKIKSTFPTFDWTIVAPFEQLTEAYSYGWHYELIRFVQKMTIDQAKDPKFILPIPTHHVLIYVEKKPLHFGREITLSDAEKSLEPEGSDPFMQYYKNPNQRAILEAKALYWIDTYMKSHKNIDVFYQDNNIIIFHIYNNELPKGGNL